MDEYGGWLRPAFYSLDREAGEAAAVAAEVGAVRSGVGILDYSSLGKIDVVGPDAGAFLDLVYMNDVATLKVGRARYGLLLNETGSIRDDGVFCRLSERHFMLTTTSGGAAAMARWLNEWHQCEWPHFDVVIQPFTTAWGTISLAGPAARTVLMQLEGTVELAADAFPHLSVRTGRLEGIDARIMRVSFSGEMTYEISLPARHLPTLWHRLVEAGHDFGIRPYGLEALLVMRTEKGFLHIGAETDAATLPDDMGFGRLGARKPMHFIGRRSLASAWGRRPDREQLVGLEPVDARTMLQAGGQIVSGARPSTRRTQGRVTSACWSPTLGRPIALGVLEAGRERHSEQVEVYQSGRLVRARVVAPCFYDPEGSRMNA
jgi:sarcosine oxidase subunit alpha